MKDQPKRTKFRFTQKNLKKIFIKANNRMFSKSFYALKCLKGKLVPFKVLNAVDLAIKRSLRNYPNVGRSILFRVSIDRPVTKKTSTSSRMGKGKSGSEIVYYAAKIQPNLIILEISKKFVRDKVFKALKTAKTKLGLPCSILERTDDNILEYKI